MRNRTVLEKKRLAWNIAVML